MLYAKQSTAIIVTVGPTLDADGVAVTGGVVGDFKISKNGGAPAALNGSATYTHRHTGYGSLSLTASDVDTVGTVEITMDDTVNACPIKEITVLETTIYDALFADTANVFTGAAGSSVARANIVQYGGTAIQTKDFTVASATSTTIVLPTTDSAGNSIPNDGRYIDCDVQVVGGTGLGQILSLTTAAAGAREYNVLTGTMPVQLDSTSECVFVGTNRATVRRWLNAAPNALVSSRVDVSVGNYQSGQTPLQPTVDGRTLAVTATGEVGQPGFLRSQRCIVIGTVTTGASTTVIPTSTLSPAAVDTNQFSGRVLIFSDDTTTTGLRGQGGRILSSTAGGQITLETADALSQAPVSGDTFAIL